MTTQKLILIMVGIAAVIGLGFLAVKSNNANTENKIPENAVTPEPTTETPKPVTNFSEFGKPVTLQLNKKITFSDGLLVILTVVEDSRCQPDVQCIWAGELAPVLEVSGGKIVNGGEVHLGTTTKKSTTIEGYTFSLQSATETSVIIIVSKN